MFFCVFVNIRVEGNVQETNLILNMENDNHDINIPIEIVENSF